MVMAALTMAAPSYGGPWLWRATIVHTQQSKGRKEKGWNKCEGKEEHTTYYRRRAEREGKGKERRLPNSHF